MPWIAVVSIDIAAGIAAALQAHFMGVMSTEIGALESMFITYGLGGVAVTLLVALNRGGNLASWRAVPSYMLLAGIAGLVIVGGLGIGASRLGLVATISIYVAISFVVSAAIDHFGWMGADIRQLDLGRLLGVAFLFAGAWLIIR